MTHRRKVLPRAVSLLVSSSFLLFLLPLNATGEIGSVLLASPALSSGDAVFEETRDEAPAAEERASGLAGEAELAMIAREYDVAEKCLQEALLLSPGHERSVRLLEELGRKKESDDRAISLYTEMASKYLAEKQYDRAAEAMEKVFLIDPEHAGASSELDRIREVLIREAKAQLGAKPAGLAGDGSRLAVSVETAKELIEEDRFSEARMVLNRVALLDPRNKKVRGLMEEVRSKEKSRSEKGEGHRR